MRKEEWYSAIQDYLENKKLFEDNHKIDERKEDE